MHGSWCNIGISVSLGKIGCFYHFFFVRLDRHYVKRQFYLNAFPPKMSPFYWFRRLSYEQILSHKGLLLHERVVLNRVRDTKPCVSFAALSMKSTLLNELDPCEDFYDFVCGGWMKMSKVPPEEVIKTVASDIHRRVEDEISGNLGRRMKETRSRHTADCILPVGLTRLPELLVYFSWSAQYK